MRPVFGLSMTKAMAMSVLAMGAYVCVRPPSPGWLVNATSVEDVNAPLPLRKLDRAWYSLLVEL